MIVRRVIVLTTLVLVSAGCTMHTPSNTVPVAEQSFMHIPPFDLNLAQLDFDVAPITGKEDLIRLFPNAPHDMFARYLNRRFEKAPYGTGSVDIRVSDLNIIRRRVSGGKDGLIDSFVAFKDNYEYTLSTSVALHYQDQYGTNRLRTSFDFKKALVMPSHFSVARKEGTMNNFLENFIHDLDKVLTQRMQDQLLAPELRYE